MLLALVLLVIQASVFSEDFVFLRSVEEGKYASFFSNSTRQSKTERPQPKSVLNETAARMLVKEMFLHAWRGYLKHAHPHDSLAPVSCRGIKSQGDYNLTLIDAADTLAVMGEVELFAEAVGMIEQINDFDLDVNVSVFETNIRILGGLLSAHVFAEKTIKNNSKKLLVLAADMGDRLIKAFDTPTGLPYGSINLRHGVRTLETSVVCSACCGTYSMEFGYLSMLTGNMTYYNTAKRAVLELWRRRSPINLIGKFICARTGVWIDGTTSIAADVDSWYEYLWKSYLLFGDTDYLDIFTSAYAAIERYSYNHGLHMSVYMLTGTLHSPMFSSLQSFWPGMQVTIGHLSRSIANLRYIGGLLNDFPLMPEAYNAQSRSLVGSNASPLRPEVIESVYFMSTAFKEPGLQYFAFELALRHVKFCATRCGFAGLENVLQRTKTDLMESFFLAETLKYLYLIFDPLNEVTTGPWLFTTEAHPLPIRSAKLGAATIEPSDMCLAFDHRMGRCDLRVWRHHRLLLSLASPTLGVDWTGQRYRECFVVR